VRADAVDALSTEGWAALRAYGVRTVVDLRNEDERGALVKPPEGIDVVHAALDGLDEDPEFWSVWSTGPQFGTPLYYAPFLERFPHRTAAVMKAIAMAPPGGVLFHCGGGRDRTGLVTALLLSLVDVAPEHIADDYVLSAERVPQGRGEGIEEFLETQGTTAREALLATLAAVDTYRYLRDAGVTEADLAALRARLR
jgi:protein-tyrosine phosphatase